EQNAFPVALGRAADLELADLLLRQALESQLRARPELAVESDAPIDRPRARAAGTAIHQLASDRDGNCFKTLHGYGIGDADTLHDGVVQRNGNRRIETQASSHQERSHGFTLLMPSRSSSFPAVAGSVSTDRTR